MKSTDDATHLTHGGSAGRGRKTSIPQVPCQKIRESSATIRDYGRYLVFKEKPVKRMRREMGTVK